MTPMMSNRRMMPPPTPPISGYIEETLMGVSLGDFSVVVFIVGLVVAVVGLAVVAVAVAVVVVVTVVVVGAVALVMVVGQFERHLFQNFGSSEMFSFGSKM